MINNSNKVYKIEKGPVTTNVIRKKNLIRTQKAWWSPVTKEDTYYSSFIDDTHYIYSFNNLKSAERCFEFVKDYYSQYNRYPDLYDSTNIRQNMYDNDDIFINEEGLESLKYRCMVNNANLLGIDVFDYEFSGSFSKYRKVFSIDISGVDLLENEEFKKERQVKHFEYLIQI